LTRLIEVIGQGVGAVSRPMLLRANADAKAYEIRQIAGAMKDVASENALSVTYKDGELKISAKAGTAELGLCDASIDDRAAVRVAYQERKRQNNIERVPICSFRKTRNQSI